MGINWANLARFLGGVLLIIPLENLIFINKIFSYEVAWNIFLFDEDGLIELKSEEINLKLFH